MFFLFRIEDSLGFELRSVKNHLVLFAFPRKTLIPKVCKSGVQPLIDEEATITNRDQRRGEINSE